MIEVKDVSFSYDKEPVLKNVGLALAPGKFYAVVGPNGSGKTTLIRLLSRLSLPDSGQLFLDGKSYAEFERRDFARRLAMLPQSRPVPAISVRELVSHGRFPHLPMSRKLSAEDRRVVERALLEAGAESLARRSVKELSGGERQRAYLAMLLAQDTPYVLLDEPTTYLDVSAQFTVMDMLQKMSRSGKCVAAVLHDLSLALQYCDELILMEKGELRAAAPPKVLADGGLLDRVFHIRCVPLEYEGKTEYVFHKK